MDNSIEIKNICKSYEDFTMKNITFNLEKGTIMGLIGENGAGKTTIIKSIMGLINLDSGSINIFGKKLSKELKEEIAVVLDDGFFSDYLEVKDINFICKNIYKSWEEEQFFSRIKEFKLPEDKKVKDFSRGMRMKLAIAVALSHKAKVLILDEPTAGLDPVVRDEILDLFLEFIQDEEKSILISSHITGDLEKIADYITFIENGEVVFSQNKDDILYKMGIYQSSEEDFRKIDARHILRYKKGRYGFSALIEDVEDFKKHYGNLNLEIPKLEEVMLFFARGESI